MHPVLFEIGGFPVRSYGVALALAFAVGIRVAMLRGRRAGLDPERILELGLVCLASSLLGARLLYVASFPEEFRPPLGRWTDVFAPFGPRGIVGLSMLGGVVLAALCALAFLRWRGMPVLRTADVAAPSVALGEGITRVGCFLNGCCHGTLCDLPWAVSFPAGSLPARAFGSAPLHPTQLYASAAGFAVFGALLWLSRRRVADGAVFCALFVALGLARFAIDFFRYYPDGEIAFALGGAGVPIHQLLALGLAVAGGFGWLARARTSHRGAADQSSR